MKFFLKIGSYILLCIYSGQIYTSQDNYKDTQESLDNRALEYCKLHKNLYITIVWPRAIEHLDQIQEGLSALGSIIYTKQLILKNNGPHIFLQHINEKSKKPDHHYNLHFNYDIQIKEFPIGIILLQSDKKIEEIRVIKDAVRDQVGMDKRSFHIDDTPEGTLETAQMVFVKNSIDFMNHAQPKKLKWFNKQLDKYREWLCKNKVNFDDFCLAGDAVLVAYGITEGKDLGYLHHGHEHMREATIYVNSHNTVIKKNTDIVIDDIIFNPDNFFYYKGLKFASLERVKRIKEQRNREKDIIDLNYIQQFMESYK